MHAPNHEQTGQVLLGPPLSLATAYPFDAAPFWWLWSSNRWPSAGPARLRQRAIVLALVAWLPLLLLSAWQRGPQRLESWLIPLTDLGMFARYVVAVPILVLGESLFVGRLSGIVRHFQRAAFVRRSDTARFAHILASTRALLGNHIAEVAILVLAYVISVQTMGLGSVHELPGWRTQLLPTDYHLTSNAQLWRVLVAQPLFLVCVGRWCWRLIVWHYLLRSMARLDLNLVPSHPDGAGGLLFVSQSIPALTPFGFALGAALAGTITNSVNARAIPLSSLASIVGVLLIALLLTAVAPMFWLTRPLRRAQLRGVFEYGELAVRMGRRFETRWLRERRYVSPEALGAPDFSATTDLYSITSMVYGVRLVPVRIKGLVILIGMTLVPFLPGMLTLVPATELLRHAAKLIL